MANIILSNNEIVENSPYDTVVGTFTSDDPNIAIACFIPPANDTGDFYIINNELRVSRVPNYEKSPSINVVVMAYGANNLVIPATTFTINILNDSSTDDYEEKLSLTNFQVTESLNSVPTLVGTLIFDGWGMNGTAVQGQQHTYDHYLFKDIHIVPESTDGAHFYLDGTNGEIRLMATNLDYETKTIYTARISYTFENVIESYTFEKDFQIEVLDSIRDNNAESQVLHISVIGSITEPGGMVGPISILGPGINTVTFSLPTGVVDNNYFTIQYDSTVNEYFLLGENLDYEAKQGGLAVYTVRIRAVNSYNDVYEQNINIPIQNDPSDDVLVLGAGSIGFSMGSGKVIAVLSANPTQIAVRTPEGNPLPPGSVLKNNNTGQKFIKVLGNELAFFQIDVTPQPTWSWAPYGATIWEILQGF